MGINSSYSDEIRQERRILREILQKT